MTERVVDQDMKKAVAQKVEADRERLRRAWHRDGYNPRAHLEGVTGDGEIKLLLDWGSYSRMHVDSPWATRDQKLPAVLAMLDISEIVRSIGGWVRHP
jgi:hypothetical protein